jgi:hypothetical protein
VTPELAAPVATSEDATDETLVVRTGSLADPWFPVAPELGSTPSKTGERLRAIPGQLPEGTCRTYPAKTPWTKDCSP